jgi:type 1 glutamine amidotransferase
MTAPSGRIDAYLVCGGSWHDFDFARLELLKLLAEDERVRVKVAEHYEDLDAMTAADFLVSYTCDVRPSEAAQHALRSWVEAGGRWFALHGTNTAIDPPTARGEGPFTTPRAFPVFVDTLGSQFLSHPTIEPYEVSISPGAEDDPLVEDIETFDATDELYLSEYHGTIEPLLQTRWTGTTPSFGDSSWPDDDPRLVMYRRPLGRGCVLYLTLGHCRGHYDMVAPPDDGSYWPKVERGSWEVSEFYELLRRGLSWAAAPARAAVPPGRPGGAPLEPLEPRP